RYMRRSRGSEMCIRDRLKVVVPSNPYDAKGLLKSAIIDPDPVIFMESEVMSGAPGSFPSSAYSFPLFPSNFFKEGTA
ncbi:hypothetical protein ACQ4LD_21585, partial [Sphingobacterium daejeonense]